MKKNYIIANLITVMSLFTAFYSIHASFHSNYILAAYAIILSFLFDGLDGKVARVLNSTSNFGKELDSLVDAIAFGVAPAFLIYMYLSLYNSPFGWLLPFFYTSCTVLRLARFNVTSNASNEHIFTGLPAPAAALAIVAYIYYHIKEAPQMWFYNDISLIIFIYLLGLLMISRINYLSFKNLEYLLYKKIFYILPLLFILLTLSFYKPIIMLIAIITYISSGLFMATLVKIEQIKNH
ncbi:MAG: CDP-diacylglycerol--serine O-phosphatidyltransferase [Deferribacterota bacterium]|nr:CDP-diacylglycerol--serine O-phosphatidyltransferase [Deferribacterota bacterium]